MMAARVSLVNRLMLAPMAQANFASSRKDMFASKTPSRSNKYERGLFHGKKHGQRLQRCFSMKASIHTMKPNITRRTFWSPILGMKVRVWISMHARRNIMKHGSFDKYILGAKPKYLDSQFGQHMRELMRQKLKDPEMKVPYIQGSRPVNNHKKTKYWQHRQTPAIYMPYNLHLKEDVSEYYVKTPQEMSRKEILELEKNLQDFEEVPCDDDAQDNEELNLALLKGNPEFEKF